MLSDMDVYPCNGNCSETECCRNNFLIQQYGQGKNYTLNDCCSPGFECNNEFLVCVCSNSDNCNDQTGIFITASQIALSIALLMGLAALVMVMYRLCTKPRYLRRQHLAEQEYQNLDRSYAGYLRASLTSIQIRVLTRLRDRPPRYESRTRTQIEYPPPPSYDSINTNNHQPPVYTEIILSPVSYLNEGFQEETIENNSTISASLSTADPNLTPSESKSSEQQNS